MLGDWRRAVRDARARVFCELAEKLTRAPGAFAERDLEPARRVGLDDRGLHDLVLVIAYFNFVNRLASGLCVALEERSS